jgi:hypothetical protein
MIRRTWLPTRQLLKPALGRDGQTVAPQAAQVPQLTGLEQDPTYDITIPTSNLAVFVRDINGKPVTDATIRYDGASVHTPAYDPYINFTGWNNGDVIVTFTCTEDRKAAHYGGADGGPRTPPVAKALGGQRPSGALVAFTTITAMSSRAWPS